VILMLFSAILMGAYIFKKSHFAVAAHHPMRVMAVRDWCRVWSVIRLCLHPPSQRARRLSPERYSQWRFSVHVAVNAYPAAAKLDLDCSYLRALSSRRWPRLRYKGRCQSWRRSDLLHRNKHRRGIPAQPALARQPSPREQLARGQPVAPRRHRCAVGCRRPDNDPLLFVQCPTASSARRNNFRETFEIGAAAGPRASEASRFGRRGNRRLRPSPLEQWPQSSPAYPGRVTTDSTSHAGRRCGTIPSCPWRGLGARAALGIGAVRGDLLFSGHSCSS
jgi:hypothetical protein